MTAGRSFLKPFSWPLKTKKRDRSGSGGSADLKDNKRKTGSGQHYKSRRIGRKSGSESPEVGLGSGSSLEIVAPASSDVEFKYSWPINSFIHQVKTSNRAEGLDSAPFEVNVNGIHTTWSLSVRFWVGENGEKLSNPFVLCLNLVRCKVERNQEVRVKYRFGIYNRTTEEPEMGAPERVALKQETIDKLQSVGYKNIAMNEKHVNSAGDILLFVRLSIIREEEANHSLSSDLKSLINDEKSSDLILEAGERKFLVHKNILAARSPVFADLLARMDLANTSHTVSIDASTADSDNTTTNKLLPIQECRHSNTSKDIRLLDDLENNNKKLENIKETEEGEEVAVHDDKNNDDDSVTVNDKVDTKEDEKEVTPDPTDDDKENSTEATVSNNIKCDQNEKVVISQDDTREEVDDKDESADVNNDSAASAYHSVSGEVADKLTADMIRQQNKDLASICQQQQQQDRRKLVIDDLPGDTVEELLKYIYTDSSHSVELFSQTLLAASDKYKLPGLKQHCEKHLVEIMSPVNVSDILLLSDSYGCKDLKKAALAYCGDNHSYIIKDSKWKTIEKENPDLFEEAISLVAPDTCNKHVECLKKGGNRYEAEKTATKGGSLGLASRKKSTVTRKL